MYPAHTEPLDYDKDKADKIEALARAICLEMGFDPDRSVYRVAPEAGPPGFFFVPSEQIPAWCAYYIVASLALKCA